MPRDAGQVACTLVHRLDQLGGLRDALVGADRIAIDTEDSVYVLDTGNYRVQKFGEAPTPAKRTTWGRIKAIYR